MKEKRDEKGQRGAGWGSDVDHVMVVSKGVRLNETGADYGVG